MLIRAICLLLLISSNASHAGLFGDDKAREQISALRQQVEEMDARIAKMEEALKSQALLELYTQVETLGMELGRLRGQIEVLTNDNTSLQKRQKDFYIDLDSRLRQIEDPDAPIPNYSNPDDSVDMDTDAADSISTPSERHTSIISAPHAAHETQAMPAETEKTFVAAIPDHDMTPAGATEEQTYDAAYRLFVNGDYVGAKSQFEAFLNQYPQSTLAPSAAYWIGNAHYALRDFQDAIDAQRDLIRRYPDSPKVPDALLNIASSQNEMADSKAARKTLEDLITQYPFSDAAKKASQRVTRF
ncbi:tol-pal system protein YbgF [Nitrosomonas sp.]|uniref:tol-pal system protein YbgF n=1 Tax=Nitrosomonas sp. TaxID=42353 RepID=UPI00208A68FB|nr:tol-pal system protein YbgF [Nitrosomonas sp.]GJL74997.1 MAG: tol-pal system protein YbgF [Nitrosomonas sp.]